MGNDQGRVIDGKYELIEKIGEGGMAVVWRAVMRGAAGFARPVAVKKIKPEFRAISNYINMFVEEARVGSELAHPNIVQVYDFCADEEQSYYLIMEWVEGLDLSGFVRSYVEEDQVTPWPLIVAIGVGALRGLAAAHERHRPDGTVAPVIHRDVSPTNVLISTEGEVKLCDFGIARAAADGVRADEVARDAGMLRGKFAYMSPEQARAEEVDGRADIFAFGILVWELLAGRRLYKGGNDLDTLLLAQRAEIPPLPRRGRPWEDAAQALLDRALAPDPARRFPNADVLCDEIRDIILGFDIVVSPVRLSAFLQEHFATETLGARAERARGIDLIAPPREGAGRGGDGPPDGVDRRRSAVR